MHRVGEYIAEGHLSPTAKLKLPDQADTLISRTDDDILGPAAGGCLGDRHAVDHAGVTLVRSNEHTCSYVPRLERSVRASRGEEVEVG